MRTDRSPKSLRKIEIIPHFIPCAEGSCLISFGQTKVICTASFHDKVAPWLKGQGQGWITAEYGMLPRATEVRTDREAVKGKQSGRTQEIQRLIGRSLRSVVDLRAMGEKQILIDCDVIQADGGTRTASITGAYVALHLACQKLVEKKLLPKNPIQDFVAAVSCGIVNGHVLLDLNYQEDSQAEVDANFVLTKAGKIIEIQSTAERGAYTKVQFDSLLDYAELGVKELIVAQQKALLGL